MELSKEDRAILKVLVSKELENVKKDGEKVMLSNSPVLNKESLDDPDLPFLKSIELYKGFLQELQKKL